MDRRGFLGFVMTAMSTSVMPSPDAAPDRRDRIKLATLPLVSRADGKGYILGVAPETVHKGDLVQIQTWGPTTVRMK